MPNTIAQSPAVATFDNATSANKSFTSACTPGSLLVAVVTIDVNVASTPTVTVSDPTNGSWTEDKTITNTNGAPNGGVHIFSFPNNAASTALTVTASFTQNGYGELKIYEITGAATSNVVDTSNSKNNSTDPSLSVTTNTDNCTIIAACVAYSAADLAGDSGYTLNYGPTLRFTFYHAAEIDADVGSAGLKSINWNNATVSANSYLANAMVAYKTAPTVTTLAVSAYN